MFIDLYKVYDTELIKNLWKVLQESHINKGSSKLIKWIYIENTNW